MRFTVPDGYMTIVQGQLIQSRNGVIESEDKVVIEQLSQNPRCKAEQPKRGRPPKSQDDGE